MPFSFGAKTEIAAPVDIVWGILSDLAAYPQWCPFTVAIDGTFALGQVLSESVEMTPRASRLTQVVTITDLVENSHVTWVGKKYSDCLVHAVRTQSVRRVDGHTTRFVTHEEQTGALVWLVRCLYERELNVGAAAIAAALKARAEAAFSARRREAAVLAPRVVDGAAGPQVGEEGDAPSGRPGVADDDRGRIEEQAAGGGGRAPAAVGEGADSATAAATEVVVSVAAGSTSDGGSSSAVVAAPAPPTPKGFYV